MRSNSGDADGDSDPDVAMGEYPGGLAPMGGGFGGDDGEPKKKKKKKKKKDKEFEEDDGMFHSQSEPSMGRGMNAGFGTISMVHPPSGGAHEMMPMDTFGAELPGENRARVKAGIRLQPI